MEEVLIVLLIIFVVLTIVTLVGHGIWVLLSLIFGGWKRRGSDRRRCVFCENLTPKTRERCDWCGKQLDSPLATELFDLKALERQLRRFRDTGALKPTVVENLLTRVERYRRGLFQRPAAKPAAAKPAVVAEVVAEPVKAPPARIEPAKPPAATVAKPPAAVPPSDVPRPAVKKLPPRKSWTEMLAAFMEERNIRWGELIGGLLIVGSSVALVISLWDTLKEFRYFPLLIVVAVSSAIFGIGLYAHHRWKLESTSRGVLIIATLLVPLNLLFMARPAPEGGDTLTLVLGLAALGIFAWLVGLAGRILVPEGRWLQVLAVLGSAAGVLLTARLAGPESGNVLFFLLGGLPVICFGSALGGYLYQLGKHEKLDAARAGALFTLLGTAAFALILAFGLLVVKADGLAGALDRLSVLVALAAMPVLAAGMTVVRGTARDASLAAYHTAGTTIALLGMVGMLVALGLAWPHPLGIIAVGTLSSAALAAAAFYYRLPMLHAGAIACGVLVYLIGVHVGFGELPLLAGGEDLSRPMLDTTISGRSGTALGVMFGILALISELLARGGYRPHAQIYLGGCGVVAVAGLLLVTVYGVGGGGADAVRATVLYAGYGAIGLLLTARWRQPVLSYLGLGLLTAAPMWLLWWKTGDVQQLWATVLAGEVLLMGVIAAVLHQRLEHASGTAWKLTPSTSNPGGLIDLYRIPLLNVAEVVAPAAMVLAVWAAWLAWPLTHNSPWPVLTAVLLAALYLLLAWGYRSDLRTWVGSMTVLVGLLHTFRLNYTELVHQPWLVALLAHATVAVLAGVMLDLWAKARWDERLTKAIGRVFSKPLSDTALLSSVLVLPVLPFVSWASTYSLALCLLWLAVLWLILAVRNGDARLFSAHQVMLAVAAVVATTARLMHTAWVFRDAFRPDNLQIYGVVLGLLSLAWVAMRILLRGNEPAQKLLSPPWPAVDWIIRHALVGLQLLLVVVFLLPGIGQELLRSQGKPTALQLAAFGHQAWLLLGILAAVLVAALWERWGHAERISGLLTAVTVPCLIAGHAAGDLAVASTLRWGLSIAFVACSLAVWQRSALNSLCRQVRANIEQDTDGPQIARATLLIFAAVPVLLLTVYAAALNFFGTLPAVPAAGSFFAKLGPNLSYVIPLVLVMLGMVGHSVRERSAGYAFSAGLVAELIVTLGYALSVATDPAKSFGIAELVTLIQLGTIMVAVWAGVWLMLRRWLNIWREGPETGSARVLMNVQLGMGAAGNMLLIGTALVSLFLFHPHGQGWTVAAGKPLGWLALVLLVAGYAYRRIQAGRRLPPQIVGLLGMTLLGLMACSVQWLWPEWGYRTLMLGWAMYAWFIVSATWWVATVRTLPAAQGPPQALLRAAAVWVRVAGIGAIVLGLKAAMFHASYEELLWAAAAIAVASAAGATMAVWRRQEGWAFSAALGVNLAASLVVWYFQRDFRFDDWWLRLVQGNVIASSAVALIWLAVRKRLYELRELTLGESPLLAVQTALPLIGNFILLIGPVAWLVQQPSYLPQEMTRLADAPGWLGLLLAAAAAGWYLRQVFPDQLLHVLGGLGLGTGVLYACHTARFAERPIWNDWLEYHTLLTAWAAVGLLLLAVGWLGRNVRLQAQDDGQGGPTTSAGQLLFPSFLVQAWVTLVGAIVLALAVIYAGEDHAGVWWRLGAILAVSLMAGVLAIWARQSVYVFISGLLLAVLGTVAWMASLVDGLLPANVLGLAVGSAVWSLLRLLYPAGAADVQLGRHRLPYAHLAARVAVGLMAAFAAVAVLVDLLDWDHVKIGRLDWIALSVTAAAVAICLWDRASRFPLAGFYALGLSAVGLMTCAWDLQPRMVWWTATTNLAGFVIVAAVVGYGLRKMPSAWQSLRIPNDQDRWSTEWFVQAQMILAAAGVLLAAWISIDFRFDGAGQGTALFGLVGRLAGIPGALMLLGAAILMAWQSAATRRTEWQYASIGMGLLLNCSFGWARLDPTLGTPTGDAPWLHRSVSLLIAAAMMALLSGVGLGQVLPKKSDWIAAGRRITPVLGALALLSLVVVLLQEAFLFDPVNGAPMTISAVVIVTVALVGLMATCLAFAVVPDWDPLALNERQRQIYVYAAEVLAALIGLHLWLTVPELFRLGIVERYWMLIVMGVAFAGAGLSEWFHRRRRGVLSEPLGNAALVLPLAPAFVAIVSWFVDDTTRAAWLVTAAGPSTWFLLGLFYGVIAARKRSLWMAAASIFSANTGLWVLWHQQGWHFADHPQLWLIPVALAALVAEHLDRNRLNETQRTSLRYLALSVIYVSSTTEFWQSVGDSLWLPLVTVLLAVAGMLAGMLLRIQSFLYLGFTCLLVVIVRLIYHAALEQHHIWVLWTCLIVLGASIIAMFAVFEKRRDDVLAAMEQFKDWDS